MFWNSGLCYSGGWKVEIPMKQFVCAAFLATSLAGNAYAQSKTNEGTIIWSNPETAGGAFSGNAAQATRPTTGTPDKNGIIWNEPQAAAPAPPPAPTANAVPKTFPPNASASVKDDAVIWDSPPRRPGNAIAAAAAPSPCREFQTEIIIDGRKQLAHGTACRQPDGTWKVVNR